MKVFFASDHAGYELKNHLVPYVQSLGHEVEDLGPFEFNETDDYPEYIGPAARAVARGVGQDARGIIIGKSGQGEAMCANRVPGVRAAVFYGGQLELIMLAREHNDANILSLGAGFLSTEEAEAAIKLFLSTPFSNDPRHVRRLSKF